MVTLGHFLISCFTTKLFMSEKLLILAKIDKRTINLSFEILNDANQIIKKSRSSRLIFEIFREVPF